MGDAVEVEITAEKLIDPKHFEKPVTVHLVSDPDHLFVAAQGTPDPNVAGPGAVIVQAVPTHRVVAAVVSSTSPVG